MGSRRDSTKAVNRVRAVTPLSRGGRIAMPTILRDKRRPDGTWVLERVHPDIGPGAGFKPYTRKPRPLALEAPGKPSKWITSRLFES